MVKHETSGCSPDPLLEEAIEGGSDSISPTSVNKVRSEVTTATIELGNSDDSEDDSVGGNNCGMFAGVTQYLDNANGETSTDSTATMGNSNEKVSENPSSTKEDNNNSKALRTASGDDKATQGRKLEAPQPKDDDIVSELDVDEVTGDVESILGSDDGDGGGTGKGSQSSSAVDLDDEVELTDVEDNYDVEKQEQASSSSKKESFEEYADSDDIENNNKSSSSPPVTEQPEQVKSTDPKLPSVEVIPSPEEVKKQKQQKKKLPKNVAPLPNNASVQATQKRNLMVKRCIVVSLLLGVIAVVVLYFTGVFGDFNGNAEALVGSGADDTNTDVVDNTASNSGDDGPPNLDDGLLFNRVASFAVCTQLDPYCNTQNVTTRAENIVATDDGMTLIYANTGLNSIGFIDITDPSNPLPLGEMEVGGEPTMIAMFNNYILVPVSTTFGDFENPSGFLSVIDFTTRTVYHTFDMEGQPDKIAVAPTKQFVMVAIENSHELVFPQSPAGFLVAFETSSSDPKDWESKRIEITGLNGVTEDQDPEPNGITINENNIAMVALQLNNAFVVVDLNAPEVIDSFSAGEVDLEYTDVESDSIITVDGDYDDVPREMESLTWLGNDFFATADEGHQEGGTRSFTIFSGSGSEYYESGNELDYWAMRIGHYPDERSEKKGVEPENVVFGVYGSKKILFVVAERANVVYVYEVSDVEDPKLLQILPSSREPEGAFAIPSRGLFVTACREDSRFRGTRSNVVIYQQQEREVPDYPTLISLDREDGTPRPFASLSALAHSGGKLYSVEDSFFIKSRIFTISITRTPYTIVDDMRIVDSNFVLLGSLVSDYEISTIMNFEDNTVNLDLEGIDVIEGGGFWVCSEGFGDFGSEFMTPNLLLRLDQAARIQEVVRLPSSVGILQKEFGFGGVAIQGDYVAVVFQREWFSEVNPRLGLYNTVDKTWKFVYYPMDTPISFNGGYVVLSDIESLGDGKFLVLERDNQNGPDAAIKRVYLIEAGDLSTLEDGSTIVGKRLIRDLIPDLGGTRPVIGNIEGLAVDKDGNVWINNDNEGVDCTTTLTCSSGENLLLNLGAIL